MNRAEDTSPADSQRPPPGSLRDSANRFLARVTVIAVLLFGVGIAHATPQADSTAGAPSAADSSERVIAYYFHTTKRCASCRAIEAYSREAVESGFEKEIEQGRLVWKVVNVETKGNEHFVKDYGLYTKSLVLVSETNGKPGRWENLEKVWQLLHTKDKFLRYVQEEIRAFLKQPS